MAGRVKRTETRYEMAYRCTKCDLMLSIQAMSDNPSRDAAMQALRGCASHLLCANCKESHVDPESVQVRAMKRWEWDMKAYEAYEAHQPYEGMEED